MFILRNKILLMVLVILASFVFSIRAEDDSEIDITQLRSQTNPFAQFAGINNQQSQAQKQRPEGPKPDLFVETVMLKFLDAKSVRSSISMMSSDWGTIETDSKSNTVIVCDTQENLEKILTQIRKIDSRPEQVMIEVVILDVKLDNDTEIGVNWDMLTTNTRTATYRQNMGFSDRVGTTENSSANIGNGTAWNSTNTGGDFALYFGDIRNLIHMIQQKNDVEIIASPRVMVVSGQIAQISSAEEIPYEESSDTSEGGQLTSTEFKDVGVKMTVGATLTDEKFILLDISSEQSVDTGTTGNNGVPVVDSRKVESKLLLEDGQVLVIGGLRKKETKEQVEQIPFLGDLPIVGGAFKSTNTVTKNSELLVMLSPHIYKGQSPNPEQMKKFNEISKQPLLSIPQTQEKEKDEVKAKDKNKQFILF